MKEKSDAGPVCSLIEKGFQDDERMRAINTNSSWQKVTCGFDTFLRRTSWKKSYNQMKLDVVVKNSRIYYLDLSPCQCDVGRIGRRRRSSENVFKVKRSSERARSARARRVWGPNRYITVIPCEVKIPICLLWDCLYMCSTFEEKIIVKHQYHAIPIGRP